MIISIANVTIDSRESLRQVPTSELLSFFNEATGKTTTKFSSRAKGEDQVWKIIEQEVQAANEEHVGRKVRTQGALKTMKGDSPKKETEDGKIYDILMENIGTEIEFKTLMEKTGRTDRQVRNSVSYLRRRYGLEITAIDSQVIRLEPKGE